jgi:Cys-tRNA(Pro)/Cys-tRNA(Cys) deacylase
VAACVAAGVTHVVHEYELPLHVDGYGVAVADALGLDPSSVFKTLVVDVDGELVVAVVPVTSNCSLKATAAAVGGKRAEMAEPKRAERVTGYVVGGISPVGQKTALVTVIDESAILLEQMHVSGGRRGLEITLAPDDLAVLTNARWAAIAV